MKKRLVYRKSRCVNFLTHPLFSVLEYTLATLSRCRRCYLGRYRASVIKISRNDNRKTHDNNRQKTKHKSKKRPIKKLFHPFQYSVLCEGRKEKEQSPRKISKKRLLVGVLGVGRNVVHLAYRSWTPRAIFF